MKTIVDGIFDSNKLHYIERVRHVLIASGTLGIDFRTLNQKVRTRIYNAESLQSLLILWRRRRWIDSYSTQHRLISKRKVVWRATQLLKDQWGPTLAAFEVLVTSGLPSEPDHVQTKNADPEESTPLQSSDS